MSEYGYDPDRDPLIQRARARAGGGASRWLMLIIGALVVWIGYTEIKRVRGGWAGPGETELTDTAQVIDSAVQGGPTSVAVIESGARSIVSAEQAGQPVEGGLQLGWLQGQTYIFGLSANIEGKGSPALTGTTGLNMNFEADMTVNVVEADAATATLQVQSNDVNLYGNHFGRRVDLRRAGGVTQDFAAGAPAPVETAMNKKVDEWEIDAFDQPTVIKLERSGRPLDAESLTRFNRAVVEILMLTGTNFPEGELHIGDTWGREIEIEVFGMPRPVPIIIKTTLAQRGNYHGHDCLYLVNSITPGKARGPMAKLGRVDATGESYCYFDLNLGRMVFGEANLNFDIVLNAGLQSAADLLGVYSGMLDELEGGAEFDLSAEPSSGEPLGFRVRSTMAMK